MLMGSSFRQMKQLRRTGPTLPPELLERVKDEGDHVPLIFAPVYQNV